jgi:hypothetical protein
VNEILVQKPEGKYVGVDRGYYSNRKIISLGT